MLRQEQIYKIFYKYHLLKIKIYLFRRMAQRREEKGGGRGERGNG